MPTNNPRLTITLQPTLAAQLRRLSQLTGNSQSALIAELLEGSTPIFDRMIVLLEAADKAKEAIKGQAVEGLDIAQAKLEKQLGLALDTWDEAATPLLEEMEAITRRRGAKAPARKPAGGTAPRGAPPAGAQATPPSNRGVRSRNPNTKVNNRSKGHGPV